MVRGASGCDETMTDDLTPEEAAQREAVLGANAAFYDAFERRDFDGVCDAWEHSSRVVCTHPGWPTLRGWAALATAWMRLVSNQQRLQFILTNEVAIVAGDAAWVSCDENILDGDGSSTVAALNVFVRADDGWKMVAHHGSIVHASLA